MSIYHSQRIDTNGLVIALDTGSKACIKQDLNLIPSRTWTVGSGAVTGFDLNGDAAENFRVLDTDPFGNTNVIWECRPNAGGEWSGGWNTPQFTVNSSKMYRFSVWVRRTVQGANGPFYLGSGAWASGSWVGLNIRTTGVNDGNPYFWYSNSPPGDQLPTNQWVLVVGHIWPAGSGTGSSHPESGRYNINGTKFGDIFYDYVWVNGTTSAYERVYCFYATDTTVRQQMFEPRVDAIDGTEPSIADLIANGPNKINNLVSRTNSGFEISYPQYNSSVPANMLFDGLDDAIRVNATGIDMSSAQTIIMVLKPTEGDANRRNPYNQAYGGYGTITHEPAGDFNYYHGTFGGNGSPYQGTNSNMTVAQNELAIIALTRGASNIRWYKNGVLTNTVANSYPVAVSTVNDIFIGSGYTNNYQGNIYAVYVYNRELSGTEIANNFNILRKKHGL